MQGDSEGLRGVVRDVLPLGGRTLVAIDVGQFLWAEMTSEAAGEMEPQLGQAVVCLIRAEAVTPLE